MSRLLSSGMCSVVSVVLLFSIFFTACSSNPTTLALRSCTRQSNGKQSVSQSINQSINQSISQKNIFGLHICEMWKDDGGTPFIRQISFYSFCYLLGHSFFLFISFILIAIGCYQNCLTRPNSYGDRVDQLSSAIMSGHMRTTLLAKLLCRNEPSAAIVGQEKQDSWQNLISLPAPYDTYTLILYINVIFPLTSSDAGEILQN